ncbi:type I glyceraldehyde-3-phosphate dehydrogenase [Synechococcus elongatus]|uniref:Glyceraldehyde-3-phosphate dehydrogenase n=2 Tax=Synechococcus elongatus TaxID=32046 RepID=Q31RP2_SYNE7|nr:type I glyceraldehyde-3-phosphate dehydrogenase [Synechococcus elongatus]ABB56277.1 glyceraldehyde-3-phosphate dehydrogenase [Synechococcus elongatus PCC 7942 = FACHB-805]AJD56674.1 glyceraldehyde-3-phosphate dehydrogenase [Synechococcus elongatus UTEX 2973]MBD2588109.1 type I glyceraldehyde-3-phosphate dehydrogenase [Synechococcus elongatus FACHB-242]MBD2689177.1 type I glyceraldehyde-3-phosphate dehydrogenase [Synechococcus elongatus FACHB-1061]MBD2707183.1 type I glyceraldehyde-3-phospha
MSKIRVGINGFGRIGRLCLRAGFDDPQLDFVAINDLVPAKNLAYLLHYDSTHGRLQQTVRAEEDRICAGDRCIQCFSETDPAAIPWGELGVDVVIEATGRFTDYAAASRHLEAGAQRVVISAPTSEKDPDRVPTFVYGVNHQNYDPQQHRILSNASCTTNCLAPIAKVLQEHCGIEDGLMTTIHAVTATQPTVDGPSRKDMRGGRSAAQNIIPASTGAAKAVGLVLPELQGHLTGMALRVPTADVSVVDLTFRSRQSTTYAAICEVMQKAANTQLQGILGYTEDDLVSSDFIGDARSSIFDATAGMALNDRFFKVIAWYDNEWGYSNRMLDLIRYMRSVEQQPAWAPRSLTPA